MGKTNDCRGCLSLIKRNGECMPDCPCKECLIKTICDTACEEFNIKSSGYYLEKLRSNYNKDLDHEQSLRRM